MKAAASAMIICSPRFDLDETRMHRLLKPAAAILPALVVGVFGMQCLCAQGSPEGPTPIQMTDDHAGVTSTRASGVNTSVPDDNTAPISERGGGSLRIEGNAAALRIEVRQTPIADVLSALSRFNVRYHSLIELDEVLDGTYEGSSGRVVSRLLDGYNYSIKHDDLKLEVIIIGRRGERAITALAPVRRRTSD